MHVLRTSLGADASRKAQERMVTDLSSFEEVRRCDLTLREIELEEVSWQPSTGELR